MFLTVQPPPPPTCATGPLAGCRRPVRAGKAQLSVKDEGLDLNDRLAWKWLAGEATSLGDFDDPLSTLAFGTDASFYRLIPKLVIRVESEAEVITLLKAAHAELVHDVHDQRRVLLGYGGNHLVHAQGAGTHGVDDPPSSPRQPSSGV